MSDFFLARTEWAGVSLERATDNVPHDGRFHILVDGKIVKSVKSQPAAMKAYKEAIAGTSRQPPPRESEELSAAEIAAAEENARQFYLSEMYWGSSHNYSRPDKLRGKK